MVYFCDSTEEPLGRWGSPSQRIRMHRIKSESVNEVTFTYVENDQIMTGVEQLGLYIFQTSCANNSLIFDDQRRRQTASSGLP